GLHTTYNHHEQACAIAAEAYARLENKIALVCVTSGPGGINALTGVCGGWLDSIPMFIVSGQVKYTTTSRYAKTLNPEINLRSLGDQEYDIVKSVEAMTKYATMIENPMDIRYACEKAWHLATTGRPGPVWIDVPVDIQGTVIETDDLKGYDPANDDALLPPPVAESEVKFVLDEIKKAERPVIYAGGGIRLSGAYDEFRKTIKKLNVPIVTYWNSVDLIENDNELYVGRGGNMGDRPGNFAVQNSDLVVAIGTRISIRQVGYGYDTWAREAKVIMVDIACGIGSFIGMLPNSMENTKIYGVELDKISAGIAQQLYQKSSIAAQGFEEVNVPDSFFDGVVGNVPFGDFKVLDKRYDKYNFLIHDYSLPSLDKLRPGGVLALVTSKGTMDKDNPSVRKYIAQRAELLGAIRLPNDTFKGNAGTEVVSDILFLQKRDRLIDIEPDWVYLDTDENGIKMNSYFVQHPEMILGEMKMVSGRFGPEATCEA
ncbi:thiamine pyrophosphate protein TPP binding domain protein, partial [human gut metagenome]